MSRKEIFLKRERNRGKGILSRLDEMKEEVVKTRNEQVRRRGTHVGKVILTRVSELQPVGQIQLPPFFCK